MADEVDITTEREEINIQNAIKASRTAKGPDANGRCHWCDEIVSDEHRWCDADCREAWERERTMRKRNGL